MFKHILASADSIDWMAILPLVIFVLFFTVVLLRTIATRQETINEMARLPLEDGVEQ